MQLCFLTADHSGRASDQRHEEWLCRENKPQQVCQNFACNNKLRSLSIQMLFVKTRPEEERRKEWACSQVKSLCSRSVLSQE